MKKRLVLILILVLLFSLSACATSDTNASGSPSEGLHIGWGRVNITPNYSLGIGGYSDAETRRSMGFLDYLYITCLAFTEGGETVLLYTFDNCAASQSIVDKIREVVSPATGIPSDHIYALATHTHSAPSIMGDTEGKKYQEELYAAAVQAGQEALADRSASTISSCSTVLENMNFVRHYILEDGTYTGTSSAVNEGTPVAHATNSDPRMFLVKFDRADESKQDILLVNWQAHPDHATENGYNMLSADFPGAIRDKVEKETNMLCAYFTGASGNQNPDSRIKSEMHHLSMREYGTKLGEAAVAALPALTPVEGTGIQTTQVIFDAEIDHSWDHMLDKANEVYDLWKDTDLATGTAKAAEYNFSTVYQARAIKTRASMPATQQLELNAFRVGGIAFTTGTYEMFSDAGLYIRENSPFATTVICTGNSGYIPSKEAFDYRSYEADTGMYAKGTAEKLADKYVEMLKSLQ